MKCDEATKREKSSTKGSIHRSAVEQGTRDFVLLIACNVYRSDLSSVRPWYYISCVHWAQLSC